MFISQILNTYAEYGFVGWAVYMIRLPEKIRKTLEKMVAEMRVKESVYGVGLFGSWSRGDAATSSDIDLLILDKSNIKYEFVERVEINGLLIDLNHIPKKWIHSCIPPEIDQKLYEMQILYDRDWSLTNTKLLMAKSYVSPERVDIRTEMHVINSDIYLSRATSALSRQDFQSAHVFAITALENILKVLVEITLQPLSNSRFIETLEKSTAKLEMQEFFNEFLEITRLKEAKSEKVKEKLKLFKAVWNEVKAIVKQNPQALDSSHFTVKAKLNYYLNPAFLQGTVMRTNALIESQKQAEAQRYLDDIMLNILQNYVWLKSSIEKTKTSHTTLMRSLEKLEAKNPENYDNIINFLNLNNIDKPETTEAINKTRDITFKIRKNRKTLIERYVK